MWQRDFGTVIDPTCNDAHVLCQDEGDGTAAGRWGPSLPGGVTTRAELPRGNLTKVRRGDQAVRRADGQHPPRAQR
ncbi:hypothetical protein Ari01nite_37990 [Paractinoplanes rishiriensis]|uniref:Uncharacterized protein n=1 Tax=Paractinoplanes rishiriensis TaxID=1050105 RepID=A0A919JZZ4_9ACTN|nr:hypothetical protein Ari01nite_37990 [Actinoplanes rishiriensis]